MFGDSNNIDEKNEDEKVQDFQGFYDSSSRREQKTFRFRETTPSSTKGKKEVDPFERHLQQFPGLWHGLDMTFTTLFVIELIVNIYANWLCLRASSSGRLRACDIRGCRMWPAIHGMGCVTRA